MGFFEKEWPLSPSSALSVVGFPTPTLGPTPYPCTAPSEHRLLGLTPVDCEATSLTPAKVTANVWAPQREVAPGGPQLIWPLRDAGPSGVTDEKQQGSSPSLGDSSYYVEGHEDLFQS